jgi:hypothetical protein
MVIPSPLSESWSVDAFHPDEPPTWYGSIQPVFQQYADFYPVMKQFLDWRFAEIYRGKRLIRNPEANPATPPDEQYLYGGAPVPFQPDGVFPLPTTQRRLITRPEALPGTRATRSTTPTRAYSNRWTPSLTARLTNLTSRLG